MVYNSTPPRPSLTPRLSFRHCGFAIFPAWWKLPSGGGYPFLRFALGLVLLLATILAGGCQLQSGGVFKEIVAGLRPKAPEVDKSQAYAHYLAAQNDIFAGRFDDAIAEYQ